MLDYNIGYDSNHIQKIGCLSKSMIDEKKERLTEGLTYLKGYAPEYNPSNDKKKYTFQFIRDTLNHHQIGEHIPHLINTIIFDSIIGNSDRHQENWGFVREYIEIPLSDKSVNKLESKELSIFQKFKRLFVNKRKEEIERIRRKIGIIRININNSSRFSPIYDSGCCLAREKSNQEVLEMNRDNQLLEKYINKGKSEIHWEEKKINHFQLVNNLLHDYREIVTKRLKLVKENFKSDELEKLIYHIDSNLPDYCYEHRITQDRKDLIIKIVKLRIEKLLSLI